MKKDELREIECIAFNFDCVQGGVGVTAEDIKFLITGYRDTLAIVKELRRENAKLQTFKDKHLS